MNRERIHIEYILETIEKLQSFSKEIDAEKRYEEDWLAQAGILRSLHTLAESTLHLSPELKLAFPQIEWHKIAAFRNALVHGYTGDLDHETVWLVIRTKLEDLKNCLTRYYREHYD